MLHVLHTSSRIQQGLLLAYFICPIEKLQRLKQSWKLHLQLNYQRPTKASERPQRSFRERECRGPPGKLCECKMTLMIALPDRNWKETFAKASHSLPADFLQLLERQFEIWKLLFHLSPINETISCGLANHSYLQPRQRSPGSQAFELPVKVHFKRHSCTLTRLAIYRDISVHHIL